VSGTAPLLVFAGGAVGAPARYLVDRAIQARRDAVFPFGTFTVNVAGSLLLGLLVGAAHWAGLPQTVTLLVGTGFCGALTTYSTFGYETVRLLEDGSLLEAAANVGASLVCGFAAATAGVGIAALAWR
jgi:fluoride exporter